MKQKLEKFKFKFIEEGLTKDQLEKIKGGDEDPCGAGPVLECPKDVPTCWLDRPVLEYV